MAPMFTQTHSQMRAIAGLYQSVKVDTAVAGASPHRLVEMLFEEFLASCSRARGALRAADVAEKGRAIARAVRIIDEGLRGGLNMKDGGALALELHDLYGYITLRMTHANLHNDERALEECVRLMEPVRAAWAEIGPRVHATAQ